MTAVAQGFRVSFLGVRLAVASDSTAIAETLDRYVLPWLPREAIGEEPVDRLIEARCTGEDGSRVEVLIDGAVAHVVGSPIEAVSPVQRALDEALVRHQSEVALIHGGVVSHRGHAILLPGQTGAGKSTLVAELVRQGALYFSDEYALVDAAGRIHPYPRALLLRDRPGHDRPVLARDLGGAVARKPERAGLIVALDYAPEAQLAFQPVSQGEGVLLVLRNTPQVLADQPWILSPLHSAVARATCYTGRRGEAREAAAAILRLAASRR